MRAVVLTGFLGTGKTTLLLALVERLLARDVRVAIIENERGSIGVDGPFLAAQGLRVRELRAGCVCCDLRLPLRMTVQLLAQRFAPQWLFVEASGVAHADELRRALSHPDLLAWEWRMLALIDVARFARLWSARDGLDTLVRPQVTTADLLVLTKTDTVNRDRLLATAAAVRQLRPDIPVLPFRCDEPATVTLILRALEEYLWSNTNPLP
ncbi:GTP-binding protein [Kallotenue papyrolyticum]|uniref:GTP-binding protein n=1 Tax=Kallotenue papyrolyticum TaxID=1325125 RepID=UPI0004923ED8|nr:GTP-binding protein [Kallotenue papyrolyticum]